MSWRRTGRSFTARTLATTWAGPLLLIVLVLFTLRGFVFEARLTAEHSDLMSFWLPRWTYLGSQIADLRIPVWNPYEMLGYRFAADPQGGWLYVPPMALFSLLSPAVAMRAMIVLNPLLAGIGLYAFLRLERLDRLPAGIAAASLVAMMTTSEIVLSMPFSGFLAWTSVTLVGAAGFRRSDRWSSRIPWLALGAFGWSQVANAHLSHGLVMCTLMVASYLVAHAVIDARSGTIRRRDAAVRVLLFLLVLPLASLAILIPRLDMIGGSSLRGGYAALEVSGGAGDGVSAGEIAAEAAAGDRPVQERGVWAAWPLALSAAPGAYAGAAVLLAVPLALRARRHRALVIAFGAAFVIAYDLMLDAVVTGRTGDLIARLPFGDTLIHNPGRLRYVAIVAVPVLAAAGLQGLRDRPLPRPHLLAWVGGGALLWLGLPILAGGNPQRWWLFGAALLPAGTALVAWNRGIRWAPWALAGVLAAEIVAGSVAAYRYDGFTLTLGVEGGSTPAVHQPLRAPEADLEAFLEPSAFVDLLGEDRYLTWAPPAAAFQRGYLAAQAPTDWPALTNQRGTLFGVRDVLGYNPVQHARYWTWIRVANRLPVFYNATVIQRPNRRDVDLMGVRYLLVPESVAPTVEGRVVATADGYDLVEVDDPPPMASAVTDWVLVKRPDDAFTAVAWDGFLPRRFAVVEGRPGIQVQAGASPGTAAYRELSPTDVRIDVTTAAPSILVVRNSYAEGWIATIDGAPVPVLPADGIVQGVPVPPGTHEVRLTYRDAAVTTGIWAGIVVWLGLAAAWAIARARDRRRVV
jgi:hypothetical protein